MQSTIQEFVAEELQRTMDDLMAALLALPEEKRQWSPLEKGRTALDQVAECAVTNKYIAVIIECACVPNGRENLTPETRAALNDAEAWNSEKAGLARDTDTVTAALQENTRRLIDAILAAPTASLDTEVKLPWEKTALSSVIAYPWWNMSYHEGQINYIDTLHSQLHPI